MNDRHIHSLDTLGAVMGAVAYIALIVSAWEGNSTGDLDHRIDALEARPTPAPVYPTVMTYEQWRASEPRLIATRDEAETALIEAGMTPRAAAALTHLAATCEAPVRDITGESIGISLTAVGDNGLAHGGFQIREDFHPWSKDVYMADLNVAAAAATRVWLEAGRSLSPWACK